MKQTIKVLSVNISEKTGTIKLPVDSITLDKNGVRGDAHSGPWNRQVSLLGTESIEKSEKDAGRKIRYGEFAENITTQGLELYKTHPLDRFISGDVILEVTQIGKECHGTSCAIFKEVGNCVMPKEGIFARVINGGEITAGREFEYHPKIFRTLLITLSDRASSGVYEDRSGPRLKELLEGWFASSDLKSSVETTIIPDDPEMLADRMIKARTARYDFIFTTGGTGIGPRDITPDIVQTFLDKEIPGIMEMIRMKYGTLKPAALLSRGVAGVMGSCLVYTLPGSVRAVNEYFAEISATLLHSVYMLHGIDVH